MIPKLQRRIDELGRRIAQASAIRRLRLSEDFGVLLGVWREHLRNLTEQILQPLAPDETNALRAQVRMLRWLIDAGSMPDAEFDRMLKAAEDLHRRATDLHNMGLDDGGAKSARSEELDAIINQMEMIR